jgi:hypothetical protein
MRREAGCPSTVACQPGSNTFLTTSKAGSSVSTTIRADCGPSVRCSATPGGVAPYWGMLGPMGNSGSASTTALRVGSKVGLRTARSASDPSATTVHAFTTVARGVGPGRAYAAHLPSEASCRAPTMGG